LLPPHPAPSGSLAVQLPFRQKLPLAQSLVSVAAVQLDLHVVVPHLYAPQSRVAAWLQVPVPEQCDGGWYVVLVHASTAPHGAVLGCCWQAPLPLQTPVFPHGGLAAQRPCGSAVLSATFAQVPMPLMLHAWQAGQLAVVQQTPSVQLPLPHSLLPPQVAPFPFFATQLPGVVVLPLQ
jgi:hypothetical protein